MIKTEKNIRIVDRHNIEITNPDRILFSKSKITKGDLIDYYQDIAPKILPYLKNRPLTMQRFPNGIDKEGFYQKDAGSYFPSWIKRIEIPKQDGVVNYVVCNNTATLVYLANLACIPMHPWLSKIDKLNYPDRMIFDLDPSGKNFAQVQQTALQLKKVLETLKLKPYVMTTGSRGLHVVVPLKRVHTFDVVKEFAHDVARYMVNLNPKLLTIELRKNKRGKKIFVDWLRNGLGATAVAPYSVRAREGAPVATPLHWDEVDDAWLRSDTYTIKTLFARIKKIKDPWKDIEKKATSLKKARGILDSWLKK
jgi:bifunctional non-homologous end joining protein LigD